jgi:hypothetical protein
VTAGGARSKVLPEETPSHVSTSSHRESGFRNEALTRALDQAITGDARALFELLGRVSGLPGPRANMALVAAFASECAARGKRADALVTQMATLHVDTAPGASKYEILPMCGVAALGARAASDAGAMRALATLHDCADDLRYRVRECVAHALARIGEARGEALAHDLASWMDGFFHASAVLMALSDPAWLAKIASHDIVIARFDEGFTLAKDAARAAARYPGYKALVDVLGVAPSIAAARFGVPIFDMLARWAAVKEPVLREAIAKNLAGPKLAGRFAPEITRVHAALEATAPVRRDPTTYVGPTRGRGRKGRRG